MLHDPEIFPNPGEFRPERFLGEGKVEGVAANPSQLAFGFGRRSVILGEIDTLFDQQRG